MDHAAIRGGPELHFQGFILPCVSSMEAFLNDGLDKELDGCYLGDRSPFMMVYIFQVIFQTSWDPNRVICFTM